MNAYRDPDRLVRAWLDLMPSEAPDRVIESVLQAVGTAPQARRPIDAPFRRSFQMNRFSLTAVVVAIVALLVGGSYLVATNRGPSVGASPSPLVPSPTASAGSSFGSALTPQELRSTWLAMDPSGAIGRGNLFLRLVVDAARVSVVSGTLESFISRPVPAALGELTVVSSTRAGGCQIGDLGRYRYAFGSEGTTKGTDGTLLGLTVVTDACPARQAAFERSWAHLLETSSNGGAGVIESLGQIVGLTLPFGAYQGDAAPDRVDVETSARSFVAVRNPAGWTEPCAKTGGAKLPLAHTTAAFRAYLATLPGFNPSTSTSLMIDGHPAVRLAVPTTVPSGSKCSPGGGGTAGHVIEFATSDPADSVYWFLRQGDSDVIYLVEYRGDLYLFQWLGDGVTPSEEAQVISTIHFLDALPGG